jgi:hypothetical protein
MNTDRRAWNSSLRPKSLKRQAEEKAGLRPKKPAPRKAIRRPTLEELKAQTAALFFTEWLIDKKQITREEADRAHVRDVFWAFGHISRGMYGENHHPKNYSQLSAIQLGALMKDGAIVWKADKVAANDKDKGCFSVELAKMPAAIKSLMIEVAQIKGKGDKARAEALIKEFVDMTVDKKGHVYLQEDVGNNAHIGKVWRYTIASDKLTLIAQHNLALFTSGATQFLTQDEESSGIIDASDILGAGWFLLDVQAHYGTDSELVEGGQLLALFDPAAQ